MGFLNISIDIELVYKKQVNIYMKCDLFFIGKYDCQHSCTMDHIFLKYVRATTW